MKLYSIGAYLLLVSFFSGTAGEFTPEMARVAAASPYDGIAVMYQGAYSHDSEDRALQSEKFRQVSKATGKDVWPWVFLNRMIGHVEGEGLGPTSSDKRYFKKIKGMDLFDETGELSSFMEVWRGALAASKSCGAPGIVLDLEAYNDYRLYKIEQLADVMEIDRNAVRGRLLELGAELADIAADEYPGAVIWCLFTGIDKKAYTLGPDGRIQSTVSLIALGMLDRCKEKGYRLKIVSGGEWGLGYCSKDLAELRDKIARRRTAFKEYLDDYPNLRLGGTISPWLDAERADRWMARIKSCANSSLVTAEDFVPLFQELESSYKYVWIYDGGKVDYNAYDPVNAAIMGEALLKGFPLKEMARQSGRIPELLMPGIRPSDPRR